MRRLAVSSGWLSFVSLPWLVRISIHLYLVKCDSTFVLGVAR